MNEALLRHAIKNIWCNPAQDRQFTYKLARLTDHRGRRGTLHYFYERIALPTQDDTYYVYQIGQVMPRRIGMQTSKRRWISLAELANEQLLHTDVFTEAGIQFPRFETYVWQTPSRNLLIAVKKNTRIEVLDHATLYLRFYLNAYFVSDRSESSRWLDVRGIRVKTENDLLVFQRELADLVDAKGGFPRYWVNGRFVQNISLVTAAPDDVVEFILDSSIKRVVDFPISGLPEFESTLDAARKYILHYDDPSVNTIEFLDDVDAYLIKPGIQDRFMGVFYHHNEDSWMRMLTHKDYSVPVERLNAFVQTHPTDPRHQIDPIRWPKDQWDNLQQLTLRLYIRHSGYERPLVADSHRIQELYRLDSEHIVRAMTGVDSTLPLWQAANLERSPYVRFMSASPDFVRPIMFGDVEMTSEEKEQAQQFVGDVYGYHAAATVLAGTPSEVYTYQNVRYADLAFEHQINSTVFEYDEVGNLLEWRNHMGGRYYHPSNTNCKRIEAITGYGSFEQPTKFGTDPVNIHYGHNFRVMVKDVWAGVPQGDWRDITFAEDRANYGFFDDTVNPPRWVWTVDPTKYYGAVRADHGFLCYDFGLSKQNGTLRFSVINKELHDGEWEERPLDIPFGQLDVFLNGRALIEGLDYVVQWPEVVISNLEYLVDGTQAVTVRNYGFGTPDGERIPVTESGFVRYGVLSNDQDYHIHTHKVTRVIIDGHYHNPADVHYDEARKALVIENERNGAPYQIQTPPVVFRDVYQMDYQARQEDDARDQAVADYMNEYFPKVEREDPDMIETQYHIISPFANKLLHDLVSGYLNPAKMYEHYSEHDIREWCKPYEWLLPYDLSNRDFVDSHIQIYPHWHEQPVEVTLYQYNFLVRALDVYLRHRPDVSPFLYVS